jgi:Stress responsive A/B Barrel Domain
VIAHVVLLSPRPDLSAADRAHAVRTLADTAGNIPHISRYRIGRRVRHGLPGYEQQMRQDFEMVMVLEFADLEGLKKYLIAPAHAALGHLFSAATSAALAYDYELVEAADAARLWPPSE